GAGHWFAASLLYGPMLDAQPVPFNVRAFAGDYVAWFPWDGTGIIRRGPDGDVSVDDQLGPEDPVQLFPNGGLLWSNGATIRTFGLAGFPEQPVVVPGGLVGAKGLPV